jgi:hypothetical protein
VSGPTAPQSLLRRGKEERREGGAHRQPTVPGLDRHHHPGLLLSLTPEEGTRRRGGKEDARLRQRTTATAARGGNKQGLVTDRCLAFPQKREREYDDLRFSEGHCDLSTFAFKTRQKVLQCPLGTQMSHPRHDTVSVADTLTPHHPLSQLSYPRRKDRQWTAISVKSSLVSPHLPSLSSLFK